MGPPLPSEAVSLADAHQHARTMTRRLPRHTYLLTLILGALLLPTEVTATSSATPAVAAVATQQRPGRRGRRPPQSAQDRPGPQSAEDQAENNGPDYRDIIPEDAVTKPGMFDVHEVDEDLFFEIPVEELGPPTSTGNKRTQMRPRVHRALALCPHNLCYCRLE